VKTWTDPEIGDIRALLGAMGTAPPPTEIDYPARRAGMDAYGDMSPPPEGTTVQALQLGGRPAERLQPPGAAPDRALLYFHGGAFSLGSPRSHRGLAGQLAGAAGALAFVPDYRLAPEHPCPAAVDDGLAAYRDLLDQGFAPEKILLCGDSAGGGLALATALGARQAGLGQPAGLLLISPWVSMTPSEPSLSEMDGQDPMMSAAGVRLSAAHYLGGRVDDAISSPLRADLSGLAPLFIQVGSEELLRSDATALAERAREAGLTVQLEIWPEMIHVWHAFYPMLGAARRAIAEAGGWMQGRLT
jgi:acetyl esterase/lipase